MEWVRVRSCITALHSYKLRDRIKEKGVQNMIHLFNRKELLLTLSMEQQARVRDALAANGIDYQVRVRSNGTRSRTVLPGMRLDAMYRYYIYVKKEDYEKARHLVG